VHQRRRVLADALQDIDEVVVRVDVVQPTGGRQALHDADMLDAQLSPTEQSIFFAHRNDPQGTLQMVCVNRYVRIVEVDGQSDAARMRPALHVGDSSLLGVMRISAVAIALQYRAIRPRQAERILDVLCRPALGNVPPALFAENFSKPPRAA
jgi:hypothetical protein